jgi:hypothetical protein
MKSAISLLFLIGISISTFAQIEKGTFTVSGSISFDGSRDKQKDFDVDPKKYLFIGFTPSVGYFLFDNFVIQLSSDITYSKSINPILSNFTENYHSTKIAGGLSVKKYFGHSAFLPFVGIDFYTGVSIGEGISYQVDPTNYDFIEIPYEIHEFDILGGIQSGVAYLINTAVSVNATFTYAYTIYNESFRVNQSDEIKSKREGGSIHLGIGLSVYF